MEKAATATVCLIMIVVAVSVVWHLITTEFPTHSDVFWTGVQCGALGVLSIIFFALGLFFLHRITAKSSKRQTP